ncbi:oligosaccharide flippase family protein [Maritimibacter sp. 55A14]|uniref:oligosaccharide flippase family protein n=1 Tax=Maritimibacter sp. 55A14 TaxID=2174844 RepID=UPI0013048584|nr:oligosaccharide flippase family protein [Maritimibacter sp. 55A14]
MGADKQDDTPETRQRRSSALAVGAATLFASGLFRQGLSLVTLAVTARLLTPEDFGVVAYFLIAVMFLEMLQRQITMVLIRLEDVTGDHLATVFTLQIGLGLCCALFFLGTQPLVALLEIPALVALMPYLSLLALVVAIRSPRFLLFERGLRFGYAATEETASRIVYSVTAIFLAWLWRDYWSIVAASFLAQATRGVVTFGAAPMMPRLTISHWRDSFSFSAWSIGAQLAQFFYKNVPQMMIGAVLGLADAGLFRLGNRLTTLVTAQLGAPMLRVFYPGLADVARNSERKKAVFSKLNELTLGVVLPLSVGMALIATDLIQFGFGSQWLAAAQVIWILAPLRALEAINENVRAATYVEGSTRILCVRNGILLVAICGFMWIGLQFGFLGALIAAGISSVAAVVLTLVMSLRFGTGGFFKPLTVAWRSFLACGAMASAVLALDWAVAPGHGTALAAQLLVAKIGLGMIVYIAAHLLIWRAAGRPDGFESLILSLLGRFRGHLKRRRLS